MATAKAKLKRKLTPDVGDKEEVSLLINSVLPNASWVAAMITI